MQTVLFASENYKELDHYFQEKAVKHIFLVCGKSIRFLNLNRYFSDLEARSGIQITRFSDFHPNPDYDEIVKAVECFRRSDCDIIAAVGGGSAMDVAKCVKLYHTMKPYDGSKETHYLYQDIIPDSIPILAIPTTAGSGSEATHYAVFYDNKIKQSVAHESILPSAVLFDASALDFLPEYQRKSTMMDAFCHAVESFWSVNSTAESKEYSKEAIKKILFSLDAYLKNTPEGNREMLFAAYIAGKAIRIAQTTAGHAMCYQLTNLYGIAHGHAAALVNRKLFPYTVEHPELCTDPRGKEYLRDMFQELAQAMGCETVKKSVEKFQKLWEYLGLSVPFAKSEDYEKLKLSVNPVRLKNHPVQLNTESIDFLYHQILS